MKKELKDVLHYYLPYNIQSQYKLSDVIEIVRNKDETREKMITPENFDFALKYCKPILHPLSSVNKDQFHNFDFVEIMELKEGLRNVQSMHFSVIELCLKNHIDIFGLIESGQAIEK